MLTATGLAAVFAGWQSKGGLSGPDTVARVDLGADSAEVIIGQGLQLKALPHDAAGHPLSSVSVVWASSDTAIATVDTGGMVSGHLAGAVVVTATSRGTTGRERVVVSHPRGAWASKVFAVMLENRDSTDVIGNDSAPYLNSLANQYAVARQYYAVTHPSIGNYLMLTTGDTITDNDSQSAAIDHDNIVRRLPASGNTWQPTRRTSRRSAALATTPGTTSGTIIRRRTSPMW